MRTKLILLASMITTAVTSVYADNDGMYVGVQLGRSNTHNMARPVETGSTPTTITTTPTNTGAGERLFFGYGFNPYGAMEMGFTHYTASVYKPSVNMFSGNGSIRESAVDAVMKGTYPFSTSGFGVFGKAGIAAVNMKVSGRVGSPSSSNSGSGVRVRPTFGVGASYYFTPNWATDVSFSRVMKGGGMQNADFIALGISYHWVDKYCGQFLC